MGLTSHSADQVIEQTVKMPVSDYEMIVENNRLLKRVIKDAEEGRWLNCEQAAKYIHKSASHLRGRLKKHIGYTKHGVELLFKREDLDAYLMKHYTPAKD